MSDKKQGMANSLSCSLSEPSTIHFSPFTAALLPLCLALALSLTLGACAAVMSDKKQGMANSLLLSDQNTEH